MNYKDHIHYEACRRAYYNISFSPERRAESQCAYFDSVMQEFKDKISDPDHLFDVCKKFEQLFLASMAAKSRCLSSMITGPAKFPVRRAEKANAAEHKRTMEMLDYVKKVLAPPKVKNQNVISSDDDGALEKLKVKVAGLREMQELMKSANKVVRGGGGVPELEAIGIKNDLAQKLLQPDCFGGRGFAQFNLTNNLANIKRLEGRIIQLERAAKAETVEVDVAGVKVVENVEMNRIQLLFPGKPDRRIIDLLKRRGFKWAPSQGAWQRMLNANGKDAVKDIIRALDNNEQCA